MKRTFVSNLRLFAQLAREPISLDMRLAIERSYGLRESINAQFRKTRALADVVLFEFGSSRQQDLTLRDQIRHWQPQLRTLFVMRIASLKYRLQVPGFELPDSVRKIQRRYDDHSTAMLEYMATVVEGSASQCGDMTHHSRALLEQLSRMACTEELRSGPEVHAESLLILLRGIEDLTASLLREISSLRCAEACLTNPTVPNLISSRTQ
jgi:multidrug resistance protein MdtO